VTPLSLVGEYRRFGGKRCLHHNGWIVELEPWCWTQLIFPIHLYIVRIQSYTASHTTTQQCEHSPSREPLNILEAILLSIYIYIYIMLRIRPLLTRWLCKQRPLLRNCSIHTFPLLGSRFLITQQADYNNGKRAFLRGPCRYVISKGQSMESEFCAGVYEEKTCAGGRGIAIVGAVTRKHLVTD
jgi:hypothetical protein